MSRRFYLFDEPKYAVLHTMGTSLDCDVSFQKTAWNETERLFKLENAVRYVEENTEVNARDNLAVIGFNQADNTARVIREPDRDVFNKKNGNILITNTNVVLMGWAADCCLVALVVNNAEYVCVLHVSVNTLKNGIVEKACFELSKRVGILCNMTAYVGACAGSCCYEYNEKKAYDDFRQYKRFIYAKDEKVTLDLYGAVCQALENAGVDRIINFFNDEERCTICAKDADGDFLFPSYRRDIGEDGRHYNGQYGLFIFKK